MSAMKRKYEKCIIKYLLLLFIFVFLSAFRADAVNWYVDNAATGENNGTSWDNALQSFADINWNSVEPGDDIYISGGITEKTYNEPLILIDLNGDVNNPITIKVGQTAGHNGNVLLRGDQSAAYSTDQIYGSIQIRRASYVTIDGNYNNEQRIKVQNGLENGVQIDGNCQNLILTYIDIFDNGNGQSGDNVHGIRINVPTYAQPILEISHSKIHNNWQDQIRLGEPIGPPPGFGVIIVHDSEIFDLADDGIEGGVGGIDFYNNKVYGRITNKGVGHPDGLQLNANHLRIYNNVFYNFILPGAISNAYILLGGVSELTPNNVYIYNNLFYEEYVSQENDALRGISFAPVDQITAMSDIIVANNTIANLPTTGMVFKFNNLSPENVDNVIIANNIMQNCYTNGGGAVVLIIGEGTFKDGSSGDDVDIIIDHNIISEGAQGTDINYRDTSYDFNDWKIVSDCEANGLNTNPGLDASYQARSDESPIVDAGMDLSEYFGFDINGTPRPYGTSWDIGAFEHTDGVGIHNNPVKEIQFLKNYPNPFSISTTIEYLLNENSLVEISLYDVTGRKIDVLFKEYRQEGLHSLELYADNLLPGMYFCKMNSENNVLMNKCILINP